MCSGRASRSVRHCRWRSRPSWTWAWQRWHFLRSPTTSCSTRRSLPLRHHLPPDRAGGGGAGAGEHRARDVRRVGLVRLGSASTPPLRPSWRPRSLQLLSLLSSCDLLIMYCWSCSHQVCRYNSSLENLSAPSYFSCSISFITLDHEYHSI